MTSTSSFPSFNSFPELDPGPSNQRSPSKDDTRHNGHKKDKLRKLKKHRDSTILNDERVKAVQDRQIKLTSSAGSNPPLYYSDRRGDRLNVSYGMLHPGDVPKYRLISGGRQILGLSRAWTAVHRGQRGIEVAIGGRRRLPTLTDSSSRALLAAAPTKSLVTSTLFKYKYEEIDGFLRIPSRKARRRDQDYREIDLAKNENNSDSDSDVSDPSSGAGSDESEEDDEPTLTSHQQTLKALDRELSSDPSSVPTWLSLLSQTLSTIPLSSRNATKARSEITLSILSRALSQNAQSKELWLRYLRAGEDTWHESKLRAEWEDALKVSGGVEIWMEWLELRIRKASGGIAGIVEDAERVLGALNGDEMGRLRVFWRVAVVLQNAGYTERATAMFQAQAELTFEVPQSLYGLPLPTLLDSLEEFWESEVPRVGEPNAKGWSAWVSSGRPEYTPNPSPLQTNPSAAPSDPYARWWRDESWVDRVSKIPARSTDEDPEADPYSMILFSDVRPLLLVLQSEEAKHAFRFIWLSFLGLSIPGLSKGKDWDDRWCATHLTSPSCLSSVFPSGAQTRIIADSQAGVLIGREKEYTSGFSGPVKEWSFGVLGPLESFGAHTKYGLWTKEDVKDVDEGFVRRVFEQLRLGTEDVEWDSYALAFEVAYGSVKSALKLSKTFLAVSQDSLGYWAAHARLERLRGRLDDAHKVYQTVLISSPSVTRAGTSTLWWDWAEMEWLAGQSDAALRIILRAVGVEGTSGIMILRAKRSLEENYTASQGLTWKEREGWVKLRGLLELLSSSADAALVTFDDYLLNHDDFVKGSVAHESLLVSSLLIIYHNGTTLRNPSPPSLLRDRLEGAIEVYPSNSIILAMFLDAEKGQGVWGRVRGLLGESEKVEKDVSRRVAEVWVGASWEKSRWETEREKIRSGLVAAIDSERTRASPIIRRMFLEFEIRAGELHRAKKMLYGAIGECPLSKELYLLAFGPLRSVFSAPELNQVADTMAERGLRLRKGLDEVLEGLQYPIMDQVEDEIDEDEIEYNASELRRLKPY